MPEQEVLENNEQQSEMSEPKEQEVSGLQIQLDELNDKLLRCYAEKENLKKRYEKEKQQTIKFANEKIASDLLETLDNFEHSLKVEMSEEVFKGIKMIHAGLLNTLKKHNITETPYDEFNPDYHQAISQVDGDKSGEIVEIHRKGYLIHDRLLRPAMVTVSK